MSGILAGASLSLECGNYQIVAREGKPAAMFQGLQAVVYNTDVVKSDRWLQAFCSFC